MLNSMVREGVGVIRNVDAALRHLQISGIHRTEQQLATLRAFARKPSHMVKDHFTLVPEEVRVDDQTGIVADVIFEAVAFKLFANIGVTTTLPNNQRCISVCRFHVPRTIARFHVGW